MWELDQKEGWALKNWCFWTVVLRRLDGPLNSKIKPVKPKGNQPWIFIGRTDAETSILWLLDVKSRLFGKQPDAGRDWVQEKGVTEDNMVGWHPNQWYKFEQTLGDKEGQGSLACCSLWVTKSPTRISDWTNKNILLNVFYYNQFLFHSLSLFWSIHYNNFSSLSPSLMSFSMIFTCFSFYNCPLQSPDVGLDTIRESIAFVFP